MKKTLKKVVLLIIIIFMNCSLVTITYKLKIVQINGKNFVKESESLDLSDMQDITIDECMEKLRFFDGLKNVDLGEKEILVEDRNKLNKLYPNINFKINAVVNISGINFKEDCTVLDLSNLEKDEFLLNKLELLSNLEEVNLYNQELTKNEKIELVKKFPNVFFKFKVDVADMKVDSNIEELNLKNKKINDFGELCDSIMLLPKLKVIDLSNSNLSNEQCGKLREKFPQIKIDWIIKLNKKWSLRTDAIAFSVLVTDFNYVRLTSKDIEGIKYCTNLQALDLGHQSITDISVIGEYLTDLRLLILADNQISDLTPLANLKHLHYLELFMNKITDLTPLASCKEMVDLNVCHNYKLSNITPILNYNMLERLWISTCKISNSDYALLKKTYPNTKITTKDPWSSTANGWRTHERYYTMINMFYNNYCSEKFTKYDRDV